MSFDEVVKLKEEVLNHGRILKLSDDIIIQMVYDVTKKTLSEWYVRKLFSGDFSRRILLKKSEASEAIPENEIEEYSNEANAHLRRNSTHSLDVLENRLPPTTIDPQIPLESAAESEAIESLKDKIEGANMEIEYLKKQKNIEGFVKVTPKLYKQMKDTVNTAIRRKLPFIRIEIQGDEATNIDTI